MDYLGEAVALGIDSIIFGVCLKQYFQYKNAVKSVRNVKFQEIGKNLEDMLEMNPSEENYVAIRGTVVPLGAPLHSLKDTSITGVIQKLCIKEHVVARSTGGFWSDDERTVKKAYNTIPFILKQGSYKVEIIDPLTADILDMDVVSDYFEPSVPTFSDHLWGFFTGVRKRGLQTTEEMLREGAVITGIGEITKSSDNSIILQPPSNGTPFYLTSMSISSLLRKLDDRRRMYRWLCVMFGVIGLVIGGVLTRRYWKDKEEKKLEKELRDALATSRKERRQRVRDKDIRDDQLCVVCRVNPREIIILHCGHVCLCEDCSENINNECPVCKRVIDQKAPAYIV